MITLSDGTTLEGYSRVNVVALQDLQAPHPSMINRNVRLKAGGRAQVRGWAGTIQLVKPADGASGFNFYVIKNDAKEGVDFELKRRQKS